MERPFVSVVIPTYNCAPFLGASLDSILAQTDADTEVVVADDASKSVRRSAALEMLRKKAAEQGPREDPAKNGLRYCPFCGKRVKVQP